MAKPVKIAILGDSSSLIRALNKASKETETKLGRINRRIDGAGKAIAKGMAVAGAAAAVGAAAIVKSSVDVASNLEQSLGAVDTIWGKNATAVEKWAAKNQKSFKATKQDSLDMAVTLGQAGIKSMSELDGVMSSGNDLVAAFGGNMKDFTANVSSAMRGEFDGLQKWVPSLSAAAVEAEMATKGVSKETAILNLINREGGKVQGQAARESKSFAGMQKNLGIVMERIQETVGKKVIPVLVRLGDWFLKEGIPHVEKMYPIIRDKLAVAFDMVKAAVDKVAPVFEAVFGFLKDNPAVVRNVAIAVGILSAAFTAYSVVMAVVNAVMLASPITWIVLGIVALVAGITLLVKNWDKVTAAVKRFGSYIAGGFMSLLGKIAGWARGVGANIWDGIKSVGSKLKTIGTWIWGNVYPGPLLKLSGKVLSVAKSIGGKVWSGITAIGGKLRTIGTWIWNNFYPGPLVRLGDRVLNKAKEIGGRIWTGIKNVGKNLQGIGSWAWGKVSGGLNRLVTNFRNKGKDLASGLVGGLESKWETIRNLTKKPLNFIITRAINPFIGKINKWIPGDGPIDTVNTFARGGWTGPGSKYQPAGVVHADEYVINKASRRKIEQKAPGLLDRLNGYASGGRVWPLRGGVTSTYAGHSGVDLNAPNDFGAPVFAVTSGTAYPYSSSWAGSHSVRLVGGGTSQIYAHLMGRGKLGRVSAGDVIGYVGSEGNSTGPHLHFQIDPSGYGPAMGFLRGASAPSGGGGGLGFVDWLVGKAGKLVDPLLKKLEGGGVLPTSGIRALGSDYMKKFLKDIPGLATGGIVRARTGGTLALLGEGGQDEAVVPLKRGGGFGGKTEIHYHTTVEVKAGVGDPVAISKEIAKVMRAGAAAGVRYPR